MTDTGMPKDLGFITEVIAMANAASAELAEAEKSASSASADGPSGFDQVHGP